MYGVWGVYGLFAIAVGWVCSGCGCVLCWLCCVCCCGLLGKGLTISYFNSVAMDLCWFWCLFGVALIIR